MSGRRKRKLSGRADPVGWMWGETLYIKEAHRLFFVFVFVFEGKEGKLNSRLKRKVGVIVCENHLNCGMECELNLYLEEPLRWFFSCFY